MQITQRTTGDDKESLIKSLKEDYESQGFTENSEELLTNYQNAFNLFESEFEI